MPFPRATSHPPQRQANRRDILRFAGRLSIAGSFMATGDGYGRLAAAKEIAPSSLVQIDAALRDATQARLLPGVVAMAANDGGVIYEGAFGSRQIGQPAPMSHDTIFSVASMIKLVTSVAALQLVEQGKLTLDGPVPAIDEALGAPQVLTGFDSVGVPQLRPAKRPITLRDLLTHTAGFTYPLWDAQALRYRRAIAAPPPRRNGAWPRTPLMFDPGTRWQYGTNMDWVGRIVETVGSERLDVYFRNHIFGPLGMSDTGFAVAPAQRARQAARHYRRPAGSLVAEPPRGQTPPTVFSGGGNLYSTAPDYLTLLRALLHGGSFNGARILRAETVALMGQNQIGNIQAGLMKTTNPALSNDVDFFPGMALRWGLGHMITMEPGPNGRGAGSLTWAGLLNTYYWLDPPKRIAAVFMTQVLPFADKTALALYGQFERGIYRAISG